MLPRSGIAPSVNPVGRAEPMARLDTGVDARQQAFQRALAGLVGTSLNGEVLAKLGDGSFLVKVAGAEARMLLPSNPPPGTALPLTLLGLNPRPTFQISTAPQSGAITAFVDGAALDTEAGMAGPGMARAGAIPGATLPAMLPNTAPAATQHAEADAPGSHATLSETARILSGVLVAAARSGHPQTAIVAPLPLLAHAPTDPAALAAALKNAIDASGLFYESHVAEWSAGKRPLAELAREPQMQRAVPAQAGAAAATATTPPAALAGAAAAMAGAPASAADPATAQFIALQLASQEQGRVAWQGQPWPGQELAWQISRDGPQRDAPGDDGAAPEPAWRSALRLRFPLLGEVNATVVVSGDQVHVALQAGAAAGALLRARAGTLQSALAAAGSPLTSLRIGTDDAGHD